MSGCDECVLGRQRKRGQPSEVERQGPQACLSLGPGIQVCSSTALVPLLGECPSQQNPPRSPQHLLI